MNTACKGAARGAQLECLRWAHENGGALDAAVVHYARLDSACHAYVNAHASPKNE